MHDADASGQSGSYVELGRICEAWSQMTPNQRGRRLDSQIPDTTADAAMAATVCEMVRVMALMGDITPTSIKPKLTAGFWVRGRPGRGQRGQEERDARV